MSSITWITLCSIIIFFLQAGFTCFESGIVQSKNVISVAMENLFSLSIGILAFSFAGFIIMYGRLPESSWDYAFYLSQVMFAVTCVTIFAGAMSERTKFYPLVIAALFSAVLIYPIFGRLVWFGHFNTTKGFLENLGYMDFAGASVVHTTAGFIALAGVIVVGQRSKTSRGFSNIPLSVLGVFILWFGWFGFNGVMLAPDDPRLPKVIINIILAASSGVMGSLCINFILKRKRHYLLSSFDGVLSGLVAITALSAYIEPTAAIIVGFAAGVLAFVSITGMKKIGIDDAVHVIPIHLLGGITGCLSIAFFANPDSLVCSTRLAQLGVQAIGLLVNGCWAFGASFILFKLLDKFIGLRVDLEEEKKGLNIVDFDDIYAWERFKMASTYESEITEKNKLLRKQARLLAVTEEQEKERLAHDLHDGVGQSLSALKLVAGLEKLQVESGDLDGALETADKTAELAKTSLQEMRNVLNNLRPEALLRGGLKAGIEHLAENVTNTSNVKCQFNMNGDLPKFDDTIELNLYRAIQECLTNIIKHSHASESTITCTVNSHKRTCTFVISDNGQGFMVSDIESTGLGLTSMNDRITMLSGSFRLDSIVGKGTQITMEVPY